MQAIEQVNQNNDEDRPVFVKSENFRHSQKMDPSNYDAPPTDRQVRLLKKLSYFGEIPTTRKATSDLIGELLGQQQKENPLHEKINCKFCGHEVMIANAPNGHCYKPDCRKKAGLE